MNTILKISLTLTSLLLFELSSCTYDDVDQINTPDDLKLSTSSITIGHTAKNDIVLDIATDAEWMIDTIFSKNPKYTETWITPDIKKGYGNARVTINCLENEENLTRKSYVRFQYKEVYPEYRSFAITQTGVPNVSTNPVSNITVKSVTLSGKYGYHGAADFICKVGFSIIKNDSKTPEIVYCPENIKDFSIDYPVEYNNEYVVTAFAEDNQGEKFYASNNKSVGIKFSLGAPTFNGTIRTNVEVEDVYISVPYFFGDGKTYNVSATCDVEGLSVADTPVIFSMDGGTITLPVTGITKKTGIATFTLHGLPSSVTETVSISTEILRGGFNILLYREDCGPAKPNPDKPTKPYDMSKGCPVNEPITEIEWTKEEQPNAEYIRTTTNVTIRHDPNLTENKYKYSWGSGTPILNVAKNTEGTFIINHLNIEGASNIKMDFGLNPQSVSGLSDMGDVVKIEYSNDNGVSWVPVTWELKEEISEGLEYQFVTAVTSGEIVGSTDFSLKFSLHSVNASAVRIDDIRLFGDFI